MKRVSIFVAVLTLIVLLAVSCSEGKRDQTDPNNLQLIDGIEVPEPFAVYSGECFPSSEFPDGRQGYFFYDDPFRILDMPRLVSENTTGIVICDLFTLDDYSQGDPNMRVVYNPDFWLPDSYSKNRADAIYDDYHARLSTLRSAAARDRWSLVSSLLECDGGISITSDMGLFGEQPGSNISDHFKISVYYHNTLLKGDSFQVVHGASHLDLDALFQTGIMVPIEFIIYTEEPFDAPAELKIEIPVKKVLYFSYLRDLKHDVYSQLQKEPLVLLANVTLRDAAQSIRGSLDYSE